MWVPHPLRFSDPLGSTEAPLIDPGCLVHHLNVAVGKPGTSHKGDRWGRGTLIVSMDSGIRKLSSRLKKNPFGGTQCPLSVLTNLLSLP